MSDMYPNYVIRLPVDPWILERGVLDTYAVRAINERRAVEQAIKMLMDSATQRLGVNVSYDADRLRDQHLLRRDYRVLRYPGGIGRAYRATG